MIAVSIHSLAPKGSLKEVFEIQEMPLPDPEGNQIRVKVHHAAINIDDIRIAEGRFPVPGQAVHPTHENPYIPGHDFAGLVDVVGPNVTRLKIGDRVYGLAHGTWAEYCLADEAVTGVVPEKWSFLQAASYVMGATVAKAAIDKLGNFEGKTGLIIGASGSIGNVAVQFLSQNGATVWAVCSGRNEEAVKALGAEKVFDYTKGPFEEQILSGDSKVDFVIDFVGGKETERAAYKVINRGGRFVTAVGPINFSEDVDVTTGGMLKVGAYLLMRILTPSFVRPKYSFAVMPTKPDFRVPPLGAEIEALIDSEHEFDETGVRSAIERVMSHRAAGKVLLRIGR